jgi:hypothetical protein
VLSAEDTLLKARLNVGFGTAVAEVRLTSTDRLLVRAEHERAKDFQSATKPLADKTVAESNAWAVGFAASTYLWLAGLSWAEGIDDAHPA